MKKIFKILLSLIFIPIILTIYLLRSFVLVRWYNVQIFNRIGTCVSMLEYFFVNSNRRGKFFTVLIFPKKKFANDFLEKKYKNKITLMPHWFVLILDFTNNYISKILKSGQIHKINENEMKIRDDNGNLQKKKIFLSFIDNEDNEGLLFLKQIGCVPKKKIICLIVRDENYLKKAQPSVDFSYHSYREFRPKFLY